MKWEYKVFTLPARGGFLGGKFDEAHLGAALNDLGRHEWELVAALSTSQGYGQSRDIVAIFKRQQG